jgi:Zn-dependent peptidase ImmA (M78 family)
LKYRHGFKAQANRIALRIREKMGLEDIAPINPEDICKRLEIELIEMTKLGCDVSAFCGTDSSCFSAVTVPMGHKLAIVHNDTHHRNRQRSNICHELAHWFLGHKGAPPLLENGERSHDGQIEGEANFLAGCLLIPNEAAVHIVGSGLKLQAMTIYGVSSQMLDFRLRMSGAYTIQKRRMAR